MTSVHIDGVTIDDGSTVEGVLTLTSLTGWRDGVDFRRERTPRPAAHGEFSAKGWKSGRLVRAEFEVLTRPAFGVSHVEALDRVIGILDDGGEGELFVDEGDRQLTAMASRYGQPEVTEIAEGLLSAVSLRFLTPDPRRYGRSTAIPAAASLTLFHRGNSAALPVLRVNGPSAGYSLTFSTGDIVTVPGGLGAGQQDVLTAASQWVKRNGSTVPLLGVTGHVPEVPRGVDVVVTVAGAPSVAADVVDTYS
ncbi:hypothetical protein AB1K56_07960 [Microbacterium sp. BWR-S6Y]|uniref:hypothetical protein n=1 Tax=Microbacterium sp. BWR-S6Y TaxID=3232073 RepID=UPI0035285941